MKLYLTQILFCLLILSSCKKDRISTEPRFDIIVCIGQSNTHFGEDGPSVHIETDSRIKQLGRYGEENLKIIPATEPLQHHSFCQNGIGFATTFAKLYANNYLKRGRKVLIVPAAKSGSSFINHHWNQGDKLYKDVVKRVRYLMTKYPNSALKAILWHQGESDVDNPKYKEELDQFIQEFRMDTHTESVPFILGGMVPYWVHQSAKREVIQEIIKSTPYRHTNVGYADPEFPFIIEKEHKTINAIHYDAKGMVELGKRYFNVYKMLR